MGGEYGWTDTVVMKTPLPPQNYLLQQHSATLLAYTLQYLYGVPKVPNVKHRLGQSDVPKVPHTVGKLVSTRLTRRVFVAHTLCCGDGVHVCRCGSTW